MKEANVCPCCGKEINLNKDDIMECLINNEVRILHLDCFYKAQMEIFDYDRRVKKNVKSRKR